MMIFLEFPFLKFHNDPSFFISDSFKGYLKYLIFKHYPSLGKAL